MKLSSLILLTLAFAGAPARAEAPDDEYARIYDLVQQADSLNASGNTNSAAAKYRQAQTALRVFQNSHPNWNRNVVAFRLNYLGEKLSAASSEAAAPPAGPAFSAAGSHASNAVHAPSGVRVKLLAAGAEPRKALRLQPKVGDQQTLEISLKTGMNIKAGEMPGQAVKLPAMNTTLTASVKEISPDGDIRYELVMGEIRVAEDSGLAPQVLEALKTGLSGFKGVSGRGLISNRGWVRQMDWKLQHGADLQLNQFLEQTRDWMSQISPVWPEEAVGIGAKWEVAAPIKAKGMTVEQTTTYELVSLDGGRVTTASSISHTASHQKIPSPAAPGSKVDLAKMEGAGTGNVTSDLGRLLPSKGSFDYHATLDMGIGNGAQKQSMNLGMDLSLRLEAR